MGHVPAMLPPVDFSTGSLAIPAAPAHTAIIIPVTQPAGIIMAVDLTEVAIMAAALMAVDSEAGTTESNAEGKGLKHGETLPLQPFTPQIN